MAHETTRIATRFCGICSIFGHRSSAPGQSGHYEATFSLAIRDPRTVSCLSYLLLSSGQTKTKAPRNPHALELHFQNWGVLCLDRRNQAPAGFCFACRGVARWEQSPHVKIRRGLRENPRGRRNRQDSWELVHNQLQQYTAQCWSSCRPSGIQKQPKTNLAMGLPTHDCLIFVLHGVLEVKKSSRWRALLQENTNPCAHHLALSGAPIFLELCAGFS